jgi:hypothetical protein
MARTLTVSRAEVSPGVESEYLRAVSELARVSEAAGRRLWLFRSAGRPGRYLECSESRSADEHRTTARLHAEEARLERRVRELATYCVDAWELGEEERL